MEPRVSLVTLGVSDLKRSVGFYRDGLGWPKSSVGRRRGGFLQDGGVVIALFPRASFAADADLDVAAVEHGGFARFSLHTTWPRRGGWTRYSQRRRSRATIVKEAKEIFSDATGFSRTRRLSVGRWREPLFPDGPDGGIECPTRHLVAGTAVFEKASSPKSGVQGQTGGPRCAPTL
jgi:catechol 2,3-dioxygenase-like lactoylglutathione lyase family enzyme